MAKLPHGHSVHTGTAGTDIDQNTVLHQSGSYSVEFKNTANVAKLQTRFKPIEFGEVYLIEMTARADSIAAGKNIFLALETYEADKATVVTSAAVFNTEATVVNAWEKNRLYYEVSDVDERWMRLIYGRSGVDFTAYIDSVAVKRAIRSFHVYRATANQEDVVTATWTVVELNAFENYVKDASGAAASHNIGGGYDGAVDYEFTCELAGFYVFSGAVTVDALAAGAFCQASLYKDVGGGAALFKRGRSARNDSGVPRAINCGVSPPPLWLNEGDTVELRIFHNHGDNRDLLFGSENTYFGGFHLRG